MIHLDRASPTPLTDQIVQQLAGLIQEGNNSLTSGQWWLIVFPGLALVLLVLSVNLLGDWLRDALNPRLR